MDNQILQKIEGDQYKKRPEVQVGDTVKLYMKIKEGSKERIQMYQGVVISITGSGNGKNIVVRKISYGVGVEKILALNSPMLEKIEVVKRGSVRRSKLYYLRNRVGKKALKINKLEEVYYTDEAEAAVLVEASDTSETEEMKEEVVITEPKEEKKSE